MESENGTWELKWDGGRKSSLGTALWLLLTGGLAMVCAFLDHGASLWHLAWSSGLLIFGLFGLFPKFSFFRLGCTFFGGYFLLFHMDVLPFYLEWEFILPTLLLLFGLSLLGDALRKPQKGSFHIAHNGKTLGGSGQNYCSYDGESFDCSTSFGENDYPIQLSRLSGGQANVSFGQLTVDLTGCEELAEDCTLELNCSFGALILMVPRSFRAEIANNTAFGAVEVKGSPAPDTEHTVALVCNVSFGQITIRYV